MDETANKVLNELSKKEVLHTIIGNDGLYTFQDALDIDVKTIKTIKETEYNTRSTTSVSVTFYEHDLRGNTLTLSLNNIGTVGYTDLRIYKFDDIISSLNLNNRNSARHARVTLYQHLNYGGSSISFDAPAGSGNLVENLRPYKLGGFLGIGGKSWTDQATSVSLSNL